MSDSLDNLSRIEIEAKLWASMLPHCVVSNLMKPKLFGMLEEMNDDEGNPLIDEERDNVADEQGRPIIAQIFDISTRSDDELKQFLENLE